MLVALLLILIEVHSKCSDRSINTCLQENNCFIVNNLCQSKQINCHELNKKNCQESQCYFNEQQQICESQNINKNIQYRILNGKKNGWKKDRQSKRQKLNDQIEETRQISYSESNYDSDQTQSNFDQNSDILNTNFEEQKIDYSKQDTIIFEIEDLEFYQEDFLDQKDEQESGFFTSSSITIIIIPIMMVQLYI
ncbi:unnamed protein product [Paramecium primaurelia]|uniref:Transmembrane protein n=1 Tax=Paramecium primaurelia TaxID=5886 RepID=A0A8S1Q655_PARPR|nr:unnamed protein product [Paramecium primaurelia]